MFGGWTRTGGYCLMAKELAWDRRTAAQEPALEFEEEPL